MYILSRVRVQESWYKVTVCIYHHVFICKKIDIKLRYVYIREFKITDGWTGGFWDWDETKGSPLSHRRGSRTVRSRADSRSRESADNADNAFG